MLRHLVALISGGVESAVIAALTAEQRQTWARHAVFIDYGQRMVAKETSAAVWLARHYGMTLDVVSMEIPFLSNHQLVDPDTTVYASSLGTVLGMGKSHLVGVERAHVVPYRNLIFTSVAALLASQLQAEELWLGFDYREDLPSRTADKSPEFVDGVQGVLTTAREGVVPTLVTPLQGNTKADTIRCGNRLGVVWGMTWSCYNALPLPCGVCGQCLTRLEAFKEAKVEEGVSYHTLDYMREVLAAG